MTENVLKSLLRRVADTTDFAGVEVKGVMTKGLFGNTPLHVAAVWGDCDGAAVLLRAGADIDARGEHGYSPLHEATLQGHVDMIKFLIEHGASLTAKTDDNLTPKDLALALENLDVLRVFQVLEDDRNRPKQP